MATVDIERTEAQLLVVALREYLGGGEGYRNAEVKLRDHVTVRAVLDRLVERIGVAAGEGEGS